MEFRLYPAPLPGTVLCAAASLAPDTVAKVRLPLPTLLPEQEKPDIKRAYCVTPFISSSRTAELTYGDKSQNSSHL